MQFLKSTEVAKRFGAITQMVQTEPVCVQSHGRPQMVMLSPSEYERLRRQDRQVLSTAALPASLRTAIAAARPSAQSVDFDDEIRARGGAAAAGSRLGDPLCLPVDARS